MSKQHPYRASIPPVSDKAPRSLWSVMIPTHNCARYLYETLSSVLAQDPGPDVMQIEVIDDHSTQDDPEAVVEELGHGRVGFYRQAENVGHTRNFQTCLERSRGKLVHLLHGDDCVRDGFYRKMQLALDENPEIGAAFCRHIVMDEHGHWQRISPLERLESGVLGNWLERLAVRQRIETPSIVVRRDVYERLGAFDSRLSYTEDWEMWVRIAAHYPVWYEVEPLAVYRMHSGSNTGRYTRTGENIRDMRRAIGIIKQYLPDDCADELSKMALECCVLSAISFARSFVVTGDTRAAMNQIREALRCLTSLRVVMQVFYLMLKITFMRSELDEIERSRLRHIL